jgi:hypothetical protein
LRQLPRISAGCGRVVINNGMVSIHRRELSCVDNEIPSVPDRLISILQHQDIIERIPLEDVRNFCFIAHVDHGKSSLSSRFLEICGNQGPENQLDALTYARGEETIEVTQNKNDQKEQIQLLDTLSVEKERGITVKASTASLLYPHPSAVGDEGVLLLNMIDTPGHADFGRGKMECFVYKFDQFDCSSPQLITSFVILQRGC